MKIYAFRDVAIAMHALHDVLLIIFASPGF